MCQHRSTHSLRLAGSASRRSTRAAAKSPAGCARGDARKPAPRWAALLPGVEPSEDDVVDQLRFANADGTHGRVAVTYRVDALKCVRVHDGQIAWCEPNNSFEHPPADRLERARPSLTARECIAHREKRF